MVQRVWRCGFYILIGGLLVACATGVPPTAVTPPAPSAAVVKPDFVTPMSNQVAVHDDRVPEGQDGGEAVAGTPAAEAAHDEHSHTHLDPALATAELSVALVPSELVVGRNRFAVGLFGADGQAVNEAVVHFHYYDLSNPNAPLLESHAEAEVLRAPDGLTTIFAHERDFARAGAWGVEIQVQFPDGRAAIQRNGFEVLADAASPGVGERVPVVESAVSDDVDHDLTLLTSALTPNPAFYTQSLATALSNGKPTVLLFATPAFCQTRFCGPAYEITSELQAQYGEAINFVHVEVYTGLPDPATNNWALAPAMSAFGLTTEPWIFLIDRTGVVVYRAEGLFTAAELERHLPTLLAS